MYSPRLYKNRDSYVLYIPIVHTFGSVNFTHTLLVQTHPHDVSAPLVQVVRIIVQNCVHFYRTVPAAPKPTLGDFIL